MQHCNRSLPISESGEVCGQKIFRCIIHYIKCTSHTYDNFHIPSCSSTFTKKNNLIYLPDVVFTHSHYNRYILKLLNFWSMSILWWIVKAFETFKKTDLFVSFLHADLSSQDHVSCQSCFNLNENLLNQGSLINWSYINSVFVCRKTDYYFNGRCFSLTFPHCLTSLGILEVHWFCLICTHFALYDTNLE